MSIKSYPLNTKLKWMLIILVPIQFYGCASQTKKPDDLAVVTDKAPQGRSPHIPDLTQARTKVLWVPDKIEPDRWEEGHFLYIIDKQSTWSSK